MQENCILINFFSCCQVEREPGDTDVVPFTYQVGEYELKFGREEFCLVTGLRFGVDFSSEFKNGEIPFKRRVFDSSYDGHAINCRMLYNKLKSKEFDELSDTDVVRLALLGVVDLVLLGHEPRYVVPDWRFRLVDNINAWNIYPWGSFAWSTLYGQLADAITKRWEALFVNERPPPGPDGKVTNPKYTLLGFTWAFKVCHLLICTRYVYV